LGEKSFSYVIFACDSVAGAKFISGAVNPWLMCEKGHGNNLALEQNRRSAEALCDIPATLAAGDRRRLRERWHPCGDFAIWVPGKAFADSGLGRAKK
jgi:hypothetical protein